MHTAGRTDRALTITLARELAAVRTVNAEYMAVVVSIIKEVEQKRGWRGSGERGRHTCKS